MKGASREIKGPVIVEVRKSHNDYQNQREADEDSKPACYSADCEDAAVQNNQCNSTGCHGDERLSAQYYWNSQQRH